MRKTLLSLLGSLLVLSATPALAGNVPALENEIKAWAEESAIPSYKRAFVDLNDDGRDDAVVLVADTKYCGSGGWSLVIFQGVAGGFKVVSSAIKSREPVFLLPERNKGWHTVSVSVARGGTAGPGQVMMRFDGREYPNDADGQPKATKDHLKVGKKLLLTRS